MHAIPDLTNHFPTQHRPMAPFHIPIPRMDDMKRYECHLAWRNQTASRMILTHNQLLRKSLTLNNLQIVHSLKAVPAFIGWNKLLISAKPKIQKSECSPTKTVGLAR